MTVDCLACTKGQTIEEYCEDEENKEKEGCKGGQFSITIHYVLEIPSLNLDRNHHTFYV